MLTGRAFSTVPLLKKAFGLQKIWAMMRTPTGRSTGRLPGRITADPGVMGGKPCIRGMRFTVGTIVGLVACGKTMKGTIYCLFAVIANG
jgi:hypothetical protein